MFHICTIANDLEQYRLMKESFLQAGFDTTRCHYTLYNNSAENLHEPYSAINQALQKTTEPYLIFCHQDIVLDRGDGFEELVYILKALERQDASWAVAGNAGGTDSLCVVSRITDPTGTYCIGDFPAKVQTLDENFLLIKVNTGIHTSRELFGFHLYGTDLCFDAIKKHHTCYAVDFHLTHLSAGNFCGPDFHKSLAQFCQQWNSHFTLCLVKTTGAFFSLSRYSFLQKIAGSEGFEEFIMRHRGIYTRLARLKHMLLLRQ